MGYKTKQMIVDLIDYMKQHGKKKILVEDYLEQTKASRKWTTKQKNLLYKAIHESEGIFMDYCSIQRNEEEESKLYMRVSLRP
ncbi:hypothetical protein SHT67_14350 (plasmid) [Enterococcus faecalis]|uniref:hypothetical protein n=1 Tax=Enterococcus faecalis TaxID=1351 RepID=UPI0029C7FB0F|nr:hypothetical protein [Enterococcus faecalis]WPH48356.1 hypothetical protein SHT67_14350 [Enterococcus faecalis]